MEFKSRKLEIDFDDPFKNDKLDRKTEVDNISSLLRNISSPIVVAINSQWGTGKTTFVQMLHADLFNKQCISIYFNAWETDFAKDPLLAFLGEMNLGLETLLSGDADKSVAWAKAKKAGIHILKRSIPALLKVGTAGIIDTDKIFEEESSKIVEELSKDLIGEYTKSKEAISSFKENIAEVLSDTEDSKKKIYIFVDELDRCRPTYAIELLERIKHLLDLEGIVFILSLDKEQLSHSVKSLYGSEFEAIGYLRRFIDIEYSLNIPNLDEFIDYHFDIFDFDSFFESRLDYPSFQDDKEFLSNTIKYLARYKKLSLREVEQLFAKINLAILSTEENVHLYPHLLTFLLIVKEFYPAIYRNYILDSSSPDEIIDCLYSLIPDQDRYKSIECAFIEGFLIAAKKSHYDSNLGNSIAKHQKIIEDDDSHNDVKHYSEKVIHIAERTFDFGHKVSLKSVVQRLALIEKFKFTHDES